jgi:Protein of unknown function (DUF2905)
VELHRTLILIGLGIVALGLMVWAAQRIPWIYSWFGNLPGDIRIERDNTCIFAPVASMLVVSLVLSLIGFVVGRFVGRP